MKIVYDDVEITAPSWVILFSTIAPEPVYHSPGSSGKEEGGFVARTICGRVYFDAGRANELILPTKHAAMFGRPCARCWPAVRWATAC